MFWLKLLYFPLKLSCRQNDEDGDQNSRFPLESPSITRPSTLVLSFFHLMHIALTYCSQGSAHDAARMYIAFAMVERERSATMSAEQEKQYRTCK